MEYSCNHKLYKICIGKSSIYFNVTPKSSMNENEFIRSNMYADTQYKNVFG